MRVSHFNTYLVGGAATAARRLHHSLGALGVDSNFHYQSKSQDGAEAGAKYEPIRWKAASAWPRFLGKLRYRIYRQSFKSELRGRPSDLEIYTTPRGVASSLWPPIDSTASDADVLNLHWVSKFIDFRSFFGSVPCDLPIVWTLHDMNAMTGGCHFADGCENYLTGCGNCPQLIRGHANDISRRSFLEKQAAIACSNLHIVAPSRWLISAAKSSLLLRSVKSFTHIPYGIDANAYRPMEKAKARSQLGISSGDTVICFGAMDMNNRRKGGKQMLEAFAAVSDLPNVTGLVFGAGQLESKGTRLPPIHNAGLIRGTEMQRVIFSAADLYVLPSLEDNLPLTGLESMACGTPILGFRAGGIPDYVRPGVSGEIARLGDSHDLGKKLRELVLNPGQCEQLGHSARQMIVDEYSAEREAVQYRNLYAALVSGGACKGIDA